MRPTITLCFESIYDIKANDIIELHELIQNHRVFVATIFYRIENASFEGSINEANKAINPNYDEEIKTLQERVIHFNVDYLKDK